MLADETQHVFVALSQYCRDLAPAQRAHRFLQHRRQREHGPAEQRGADDHFNGDRRDRLERFAANARLIRRRSRIEFHYAGEICDCLHARERQDHADELDPEFAEAFMARFEELCRQVRCRQSDQNENDDHGWKRQRDCQGARVFRPKPVDEPEEQQHDDGCDRDVVLEELEQGHLFRAGDDVGERRPAAQRRGYRQVGYEEQRAHHRQQSALRSRRRVNSAAIWKMPADDRIIDSHQTSERADRQDDWQRRKPGGDKRQPDDIRLARAPIAVEERRRPLPIHVAWTMCGGLSEN